MERRHIFPIIGSFVLLLAVVTVGCYHRKTPEQRAEYEVQRLVSTLNLDAEQTAKLEIMKKEYLSRRPETVKMREESIADLKEIILSPQLDQARLNARMEKIQAHTSDLIKFASAKFAELHDMLTPEQRRKLVEEMEKHASWHHHW